MRLIFAFGLFLGTNGLKCHSCYEAVDQMNNTIGAGDKGCFAGEFEDEKVRILKQRKFLVLRYNLIINKLNSERNLTFLFLLQRYNNLNLTFLTLND